MISLMYAAIESRVKQTLTTWKVHNITGISEEEFLNNYATENQAACVSYKGFENNEVLENRTYGSRLHIFYVTIIANTDVMATIENLVTSFDTEVLTTTDELNNKYHYNFTVDGGDFSTYYGGNIFEMRVTVYA